MSAINFVSNVKFSQPISVKSSLKIELCVKYLCTSTIDRQIENIFYRFCLEDNLLSFYFDKLELEGI